MNRILDLLLPSEQAALWFLGQAGYVVRSGELSVAIDPYLSNSAAANRPEFNRCLPVPIEPKDLKVDLYVVTHDHLDHLDPDTLRGYRHRATTQFLAPRLAGRKLIELGVPEDNLTALNAGETTVWRGVTLEGTFALPTSADVLDTTGYVLRFPNGRSVYHTSDTAFTPLLLEATPQDVEVLLVPINGKWRNLNVEQAVELTAAVNPRFVFPNHFDMMALNAENPESFRWLCEYRKLSSQCIVPAIMQPFLWD